MSTGNAPAALMTWPSRGTLKSASQAINRIVRLIGSPTSSGSRYDGWLPAMITAPSSGTFSTPWCSSENRTRNSGRAMSLMIELSIGFGVVIGDLGLGIADCGLRISGVDFPFAQSAISNQQSPLLDEF